MRIGLHFDGIYLSILYYFNDKEVTIIFKHVIIVGGQWCALRSSAGRRHKQAKGSLSRQITVIYNKK